MSINRVRSGYPHINHSWNWIDSPTGTQGLIYQEDQAEVKRNKKSDNVKDSSFSNVAIRVARSIQRESLLPVNDDDYDDDDDGSDDDDEAGPRLQADEEPAYLGPGVPYPDDSKPLFDRDVADQALANITYSTVAQCLFNNRDWHGLNAQTGTCGAEAFNGCIEREGDLIR
jgi:hypothetical protein